MKLKHIFVAVALILLSTTAGAQKVNDEYKLFCNRAVGEITIDGVLDEETWIRADVAQDFHMILPMDTSLAEAKTEVRVSYDDKNFYISAVCYLKSPGKIVVASMKRDFSFGSNDNFFCIIDPFNDLTNGFTFGANAAGAEWDGQIAEGSQTKLDWDNKWKSKVKNYEDKWIFEGAIPFKTLRYKKDIKTWGINFSRLDLTYNEKSSWTPIPRQFPSISMAFTGNMIWDETPPSPGTNISLIPYVKAASLKNNEDGSGVKNELDAGFDAKISLTPSLNLDLTVNSDFSQVEVDRQVTNLSRFELFFPERRQFFLENSDLFANLGFRNTRPFFSRRIGLESPIIAGGRLSGKLNEKWRVGVMDIQTGETDPIQNSEGDLVRGAIPTQNFAVAVLQRQVFARSNITVSFINKESFNLNDPKLDTSITEYNRDIGLGYNLFSSNNLWNGKLMLHKSFSPNLSGDDIFHAANLEYESRKFGAEWVHEYVGENYNPEVGYVQRKGYYKIAPDTRYTFFTSNSSKLVSHGPMLDLDYLWDKEFNKLENEIRFRYSFNMLDRSSFGFGLSQTYIRLQNPFDPTNSGGEKLPAGSDYSTFTAGFNYQSAPRNLLTYEVNGLFGGYFNGNIINFDGGVGYRFQPYGSINLDFSYNDISLPEPYTSESYWLVSPRVEMTFTNKIFWTTFVQYNEQADNVNLNTRFQWRFLPASDIFLVYTENYLPGETLGSIDFNSKNRALVLKITYWYNI